MADIIKEDDQKLDYTRELCKHSKVSFVLWAAIFVGLILALPIASCYGDTAIIFLLFPLSIILGVATMLVFLVSAYCSKNTRRLKLACAFLSLPAFVLAIIGGAFLDGFLLLRLPVTSPCDWPKPLQTLLEDANKKQIKVGVIKLYCAEKGFLDEYYWEAADSPEMLAFMKARWTLSPMDKSHSIVHRSWTRMPFALYWSSHGNEIEYFANWGHKDDNYVVMNDKTRKCIIVRYMYNF